MNKRLAKQLTESLSPEEIIARGQRAKLRFRSAIRFVIKNLYWLVDADEEELGDNVQKNILLLTRKKSKKSLLTLQDKCILTKPTALRSEEEKLHLSRIIGGLKCFRRYPAHVKIQLAGVTYFFYYGPGRTIVRQGHESMGLYFIITGGVSVSQETFDPVENEVVNNDAGTMGPGSMFGEVSLLHDIARTNTVTSSTHVELLCVKKDDFNVVLKATVKQQWDNVRNAMRYFTYFDDWDRITVRDCCILGKIKTFLPTQTVLGDAVGYYNYVYFIMSGKCRIIEHMFVTIEIRKGKKFYKLYVPPPASDSSSNSGLLESEEEPGTKSKSQTDSDKRGSHPDGDDQIKVESNKSQVSQIVSKKSDQTVKFGPSRSGTSTGPAIKKKIVDKMSFMESRTSGSSSSRQSISQSTDQKPSVRTAAAAMTQGTNSKYSIDASDTCLPSNVETYFMQVALLNPTACFGIGENMEHRRVVAVEPTECLIIPRYWILQQNKGNIWNKVRCFLNTHIPTTKQVFKHFVDHRNWVAYRKKLFEEALPKKRKISNNDLRNVPYFLRINEELDL